MKTESSPLPAEAALEKGTQTPRANSALSTFIAILIGLVSVAGALIAWRVAEASNRAGNADTDALLAAVDAANAFTSANTVVTGQLVANSRALRDDALARALAQVEAAAPDPATQAELRGQREELRFAASRDRAFVPRDFLDLSNNFDAGREVSALVADAAAVRDTNPAPHFETANENRAKAESLIGILVLLGAAFVLLTLADAVERRVRYLFLAAAILILVAGSVQALRIEFQGPAAAGIPYLKGE